MDKPADWFTKPSGKIIIIVLIVWLISITLLLVSSWNGAEMDFKPNIVLLLLFPSTVAAIKMIINYFNSVDTFKF